MPEKDSFYYLNAYQDGITPGQKMTIQHNISFNDWRAGPHIAPLVTLTSAEVTQRKEASITLEKELYAQLKKLAAAWDEQAAQTMLLERALEYLHIIANGYPTRGLAELKLENKYHAYYATKMALWCYLLPNWNINNLKVNPNLTGTEFQRAQAILTAAKDIYVRGTAWSKVYSPRVTATPDRDAAYATTVNGQQYTRIIPM